MKYETVAVVGPTASGKTGRAVDLAKAFSGEVISADSRQVYRNMDIGTGKDLGEYDGVRAHLLDVCDAGDKYNLHNFLRDFRAVYLDLLGRGKLPVICGGSGMYVESALGGLLLPEVPENDNLRKELSGKSLEELTDILKGYRKLHNTTDVDTCQRAVRAIEIEEYYRLHPQEAELASRKTAVPLDALIVGIDIDRESRRRRITERLHSRLEEGMVKEVETLLKMGIPAENLIYYGLEYKFLTLYVTGRISYEEMVCDLETAIHQFAKRQMTWFRGMERRGFRIHWIPYDIGRQEFVDEVGRMMRGGTTL